MRIISDFKDYYDNVQGVMFNSDTLFIRKRTADIPLNLKTNGMNHMCVIGFCGKLYPLFKYNSVDISNYGCKKDVNNNGYYITYNLEEVEEIYLERYKSRYYYKPDIQGKIAEILNDIEQNKLFAKYNTPIFVVEFNGLVSDYKWCVNITPCLKNYNFQTQKDTYTTFQDIVMWLNNIALPDNPPQISDDNIIRDAKGFDKWSFKKQGYKKR